MKLMIFGVRTGLMGAAVWSGDPGVGRSEPHERRAHHDVGRRDAQRLATANRRRPDQRLGSLRMPGQHRAQDQLARHSPRRRSVPPHF